MPYPTGWSPSVRTELALDHRNRRVTGALIGGPTLRSADLVVIATGLPEPDVLGVDGIQGGTV